MTRLSALALVVLALFTGSIASAQTAPVAPTNVRAQAGTTHELALRDGSRLYGEIVTEGFFVGPLVNFVYIF